MRRAARPPVGDRTFGVRLKPLDRARLEELAKHWSKTESEVMRECLAIVHAAQAVAKPKRALDEEEKTHCWYCDKALTNNHPTYFCGLSCEKAFYAAKTE